LFFIFDQEKRLQYLQSDRAGTGGEYHRIAVNMTMIDDDLIVGNDRFGSFFALSYQQEVQQVTTACYHYLGETALKVKNCTINPAHKIGTTTGEDRYCLVTVTITGEFMFDFVFSHT
jgi:hypothetical protein